VQEYYYWLDRWLNKIYRYRLRVCVSNELSYLSTIPGALELLTAALKNWKSGDSVHHDLESVYETSGLKYYDDRSRGRCRSKGEFQTLDVAGFLAVPAGLACRSSVTH